MIEQEHPELTIERICNLFEVSRSWYYEPTTKPDSDEEETTLRDQIKRIILEFG